MIKKIFFKSLAMEYGSDAVAGKQKMMAANAIVGIFNITYAIWVYVTKRNLERRKALGAEIPSPALEGFVEGAAETAPAVALTGLLAVGTAYGLWIAKNWK